MSRAALANFSVQWFDFSSRYYTFTTLLKYCDTAQGFIFENGRSSSNVLNMLHKLWDNQGVEINKSKIIITIDTVMEAVGRTCSGVKKLSWLQWMKKQNPNLLKYQIEMKL